MVTVSHIVGKIVKDRPFLEEALSKGLINYFSLAEQMKEEIEKELGKDIKTSAVMMAIRRLKESLERNFVKTAGIKFRESDITIKSDLVEFTFLKSPSIICNVRKLYDSVDFSRGDFLTITHGLYEITIIASKKYGGRIEKIFESEKLIKKISSLTSLTIIIPPEALNTAGFFYIVTKALNWENISIVEIVSTLSEMTLILKESDLSKAFNSIKSLIEKSG